MIKVFNLFALILLIKLRISFINCHGYLANPVSRSSAWRLYPDFPRNYNDKELYCGGLSYARTHDGKCGVCGDPYGGYRNNEVGGKFVTRPPKVVKTYLRGEIIPVVVNLTANHRGFFVFQVCPSISDKKEVSEYCLNSNNLEIVKNHYSFFNKIDSKNNSIYDKKSPSDDYDYTLDEDNEINNDYSNNKLETLPKFKNLKNFRKKRSISSNFLSTFDKIENDDNTLNPVHENLTLEKYKYHVKSYERSINIKVKLPADLECERCVFRWIYVTGNNWGNCGNGKFKSGCGFQEEYRNCADIEIL